VAAAGSGKIHRTHNHHPRLTAIHHPRPIHRWKTLWLGLLVLIFLLWAWARSLQHRDSLNYGTPGGRFMIECRNSTGTASLRIGTVMPHYCGTIPPGITYTTDTHGSRRWFRDPGEITRLSSGPYWIQIAHWLLLVLFLLPWLGLLAWRQRRMKRHATAAAPPSP
jgi:hypothetical protein